MKMLPTRANATAAARSALSYAARALCYCKTCHANGIEPYDMLVTSIAMAGDYPEGSSEAMKLLVHNNLIFYKKKDAEFIADVKKAREKIEREG